jgi:TPR repeat protein
MPAPMQAPGASAPYNGPVGRGMLPRPSTSSGNRPPPQRQYPNQPPVDPYANENRGPPQNQNQGYPPRGRADSVSDLYDSYYDTADPRQQSTPQSAESVLPDFDALASKPVNGRRGGSMDEHIRPPIPQATGYQQKPVQAQPGGRMEPQAAVFEMAGDAPPMPNAYPPQQSYADDGYGNQYQQPPDRRGPPQGYGSYEEPLPPPNAFQPPPRSASAAPEGRPGLPMGPKSGFNGLPNSPSPNGLPGGPARSMTMPRQAQADGLPSHPPPFRAGLIPNTVANQAMNRPPPVRNYNNVTPQQQQAPAQQAPPQQQQTPPQQAIPAPVAPAEPPAAPVTTEEIERLRTMVKANPNGDQETQMIFVKKLVEASEVLAPLIPDQRARNKVRERYILDAHKMLKKLVAAQHTEAMFYLADCHGRGALGLETDNKEAFTLYQSAAKAGHAAAAYRTAVCCELGNDEGGGTRKDPLKAIQWYKRAAMLGDTPAMYKMGMILLKGLLGQPRNPREAVGWLKRAAERADIENPHAVHELALLYEQPQSSDNSVVRDEGYSFKLFNQAADLGYKFSQFRLGAAYEYGLFNCPIDPRQSIMWYSRAAAQAEHQSELALSGWYLTGSEGVLQQSDTEAYLWARKAAMAGLAKAEYAMGYFTEVGIGAPANLEDAKRWYWRAAGMSPHPFYWRFQTLRRENTD